MCDRIAILGYEGRPGDLAPEVVAETGLDHRSYYDQTLDDVGGLARSVLVERGIAVLSARTFPWGELWDARPSADVVAAGVDVVAVDLDRRERLDPARFGDSRDLNLAAASGGMGGVTAALTLVLAASNRGGTREVREILETTREGSYVVDGDGVRRGPPPWRTTGETA